MLTLHYQENNTNTAKLHLREKRSRRMSTLLPSIIHITGYFEQDRAEVENFIKKIYADNYGADIQIDYPLLMSLRDEHNTLLAAVGFRYAKDENLFLEHYTEKPIEQVLNCPRQEIVEIGNLASAGKGASAFLFAALASYLNHKKISYAAITGTDFLHAYFKRAGLKPRKICNANIGSIGADNQKWGTYYDTKPRVLVGSVDTGVKYLHRMLGAEFETCPPQLFPRLHYQKDK